jgi:hypothetical protein
MKRLLATFVLCILLVGCAQAIPDTIDSTPDSSPAISPVLSPIPLSTETIDLSGGKATLVVLRTFDEMLGHFTVTASIPLFFMIDEDNPEKSTIVFGKGNGTATLNGEAKGSGYKEGYSSSYTITAEWPAEYEVKGSLDPSQEECYLSLDVDEVIPFSQMVIAHTSLEFMKDIPLAGGIDTFTSFFKLLFTETNPFAFRNEAGIKSTFTIEDWCLPKVTGCTPGCS